MKKITIICIIGLFIALSIIGLLLFNNQIDIKNNKNAINGFTEVAGGIVSFNANVIDEREIDDSNSIGDGIKFIFINAITGKRIRNARVIVDVDSGRRCITAPCDSTNVFFEGATDDNGVEFIDFSNWPNDTYGRVNLDDWGCNGAISDYAVDGHLFFTAETTQFMIECINENYRYVKLIGENGVELHNIPVSIDIEKCTAERCQDLEDIVLYSNNIGNVFFDPDYTFADTNLIVEGYKPFNIRHYNEELPEIYLERN